MRLEVEGRNTEVHPRWQTLIERKVAKLERAFTGITRARVTLIHNPHHQAGDNEVHVVLSVPGRTLTVRKSGAQIADALRAALTAAEREFESYRKARKRYVKQPKLRPVGTIARLVKSRGYGFILTDTGREIYFRESSLDRVPFDRLEKGMLVTFELAEGDNGLRAPRVTVAPEQAAAR